MAPSVVHPLPLLGTPGAPAAFEGRNVSSFLKKFEAMCDNFGIDEETKVRRIPEYCDDDIGREVEAFETWKKKDWEGLKDEMRKEWRQGDVEQLMYTRPLLEEYVSKPRGREGLKQYHRQFNRISTALVGKDELDAYSQGRLFILGLPECVRRVVLSKDDIGSEAATGTVDYAKALKIVKGIVAADERMASFFMRPEKRSEISNLAVAMNEPKPVLTGESAKVNDSGEKAKMRKDQQEDTVAALTESFKALTLPLTAAISELKSAATNPRERPTGGSQGTRLDPALDRRPGARYGRDGRPMICYMCGEEGHTLNRCDHTRRLATEGQIHLNQENRPCLGPMREGAYPVIKQPNMTLLETIEKLVKMRDPNANAPAGVSFIHAIVEDDSDLEVEDIGHKPASAETFAARADIGQRKRSPARRGVTEPVKDPRMRATKQIAQRQDRYPIMKSPRTGIYEPATGESSGTVQQPEAMEDTVDNEEPMEDAIAVEGTVPAKPAKEKTPKTTLKKMLKGTADARPLVDRMLQTTVTMTWAEALSISGDLRKIMFGTFADPKANTAQSVEVSKVTAKIEAEIERAYDNIRRTREDLYIAASPTAPVKIN